MNKKALIIEDDTDIASLVAVNLRDINCEADIVHNGVDGLNYALSHPYDVIILDIMLPELDGMEVCRRIREQHVTTPILMLTAKEEEVDKLLGINLGADDYVTKPFSIRELIARVKAKLRRFSPDKEPGLYDHANVYESNGLKLEILTRKVTIDGKKVDLTAKEFDLLSLFMKHPGRVFTRAELLDMLWGYSFSGYEHTVNSHINRLRIKIEKDPAHPHFILTVWGVGYKFNDETEGNPESSPKKGHESPAHES